MATFKVGNIEVIDLRESLPRSSSLSYDARGLGQIEQIVIHHSATPDTTAEAIASYHVNTLGWPGIAYHFLVHSDGRIEYTNGVEVISYGVARRNDNTMHICMPGDFTTVQPGETQIVATRLLIDNLRYAMGQAYPVVGHKEIAPPDYATSCPGATWVLWRDRLVGNAPVPSWQSIAAEFEARAKTAEAKYMDTLGRLTSLKVAITTAVRKVDE
jgi:N-acetyl-anhydromuramyl-L-alanine amidase AmpD